MRRCRPSWVLLFCMLAAEHSARAGQCTLARFAELQLTMAHMKPLVRVQINGVDASFVVDSGAFYSSLTSAAAEQFGLRLQMAPPNFVVTGVGGATRPSIATVKTFTLASQSIHNIEFLVLGNDLGDEAVGLLGQNVLRISDLEYDLANGVIRFIRPQDCNHARLAYWAAQRELPYSVIDIESATPAKPYTAAAAEVNGSHIRVIFDTGAATSILSLEAARRAGVTPESQGVVSGGVTFGVGHEYVSSWIAPFARFKIGEEEIRNTQLRIGGVGSKDYDMLLGADFFLSHHIYVASSQRKLYFTYNGGPVFNLTSTPAPAATAATQPQAQGVPGAPPATANSADAGAAAVAQPGEPTDAAGFARRGAASASRRDYQHALADFSRACELAPTVADYFYGRGLAHWSNQQPDLALADFTEAIRLKPEDVPSLVARAGLRASRGERDDAVAADLDAADGAAAKEDALRLTLGELYEYLGRDAAAVVQYSKWIESRPANDVRMAQALNSRCWARGMWGEQLDQALDDCNRALRSNPKSAEFLDSRGLVYLRRGNYEKAVADYEAALRLSPKSAWSLYGRGLARLHLGQSADGQADLAAATALNPKVASAAGERGLKP